MSWASALKNESKTPSIVLPPFATEDVEWSRLVVLDFESYFDTDYTLSKLSTSEYVRDPRFKAQMVGLKIGTKPTRIIPHAKIASELRKIPWTTHSLLCHHTQFDAFILSHHYGIQPKKLYDTLSMARGLHSNEIGAGLDEVSRFYGGVGKLDGILEQTKGVRVWPKALYAQAAEYCANDIEECLRIFKLMLPKMPRDEIDLIDLTVRMFTDPVLKVDIPRVKIELAREIEERKKTMLTVASLVDKDDPTLFRNPEERALEGEERDLLMVKRAVGSNPKFAAILIKVGVVKIPEKISPAWIKRPAALRKADESDKFTYAFSKDDLAFTSLPDEPDRWGTDLIAGSEYAELQLSVRSAILRALVDTRLAVKSTTNITRAERFLTAGANGMPLPAYYAYARAHTLRWGGGDKRNMQNLKRPDYGPNGLPIPGTGELRQSILAPNKHQLVVADSGQIEARTNGWLWGQEDLLLAFRAADEGVGRDPYCLMGDAIYHFPVTKKNKVERFVGKVCVLALGYGMGAAKFQLTLARGALGGAPVIFDEKQCQRIVNVYRSKNSKIVNGWTICGNIIIDMAAGRPGSHKCISWDKETVYLPNGLTLRYPDLKMTYNKELDRDEWTYQSGRIRKKMYGALLCENIVQALARIIIGVQMLAISRKYRVVMTTHDEIVACVKTAAAQKAFNFMIATMRTPLDWCPDIPLNAEGGFASNYSK